MAKNKKARARDAIALPDGTTVPRDTSHPLAAASQMANILGAQMAVALAERRALSPLEERLATNVPLAVPRLHEPDEPRRHVKNPSVVVRADGRYGVASAGAGSGSGFAHEAATFATRDEAERRAWALARELGVTGDWP